MLDGAALHQAVTLRTLGPDGEHFLIPRSGGMTPLERLARDHVHLAELAIDHRALRAHRLNLANTIGYRLFSHRSGKFTDIATPEGAWVSGASFSPNGKKLAFLAHSDRATELFVADVATGRTRRVTGRPLLATLVSSLVWTWDSNSLLAVVVPERMGPLPQPASLPSAPRAFVSDPGRTPNRTFRFLLQSPFERRLLEHLITGQLCLIEVATGELTPIGKPAMLSRIDVAPDGKYFRVSTVQKPFSYSVPLHAFGTRDEIWDISGKPVARLGERKLRLAQQSTPPTPSGKRALGWRPDGHGLSYLEREPPAKPARPSGTPNAPKPAAAAPPVKRKDRVMQWLAPYSVGTSKVVWESEIPIDSVAYSQDCQTIYVTQTDKGTRRVFAVELNNPNRRLTILDHPTTSTSTPGAPPARGRAAESGRASLLTKPGKHGGRIVRRSRDRRCVFVSGVDEPKDASRSGARTYVDRIEPGSNKRTRVWQGAGDAHEALLAVLDDDFSRLIISHETATEVPNSYLLDRETKSFARLTDNTDPAPEVTMAERLRFRVERVDGFKFWVSVTIPRHYGDRLPALFWVYPREFTDQKTYDDQRKPPNPHRFPTLRPRSMELLVLHGYVVVTPDCPIVGPRGRMNDNFVADLRNSLWAVIDELDKRQIIDRDRLAIGGHSYGAFATANALAHTPFFKAGIAGDGNYNRTLTPMSFQSERRFLWDARETYLRMSPLLYANQIQGALLMYHGLADSNSGTFPLNSPRLFQALNGLGKHAALYLYPHEEHGPVAGATVLDLWARWCEWLDVHVKDPHKGTGRGKVRPTEDRTR